MAYEYGQMESCITLQGRNSHENYNERWGETLMRLQFPTAPSINLTKLKAFHMGAAEMVITIKKYIRAKAIWKHWSILRAYQYGCRSCFSFTKTTLSLLLVVRDSEGKKKTWVFPLWINLEELCYVVKAEYILGICSSDWGLLILGKYGTE